jgi:hypothetical protein
MTTPISYSVKIPSYDETNVTVSQTYRTKKSFVAVHFDPTRKGGIVFLPQGVKLRILEPSACLNDGFKVLFGKEVYNVFKVDLLARSTRIFESLRALPACA